MHTQQGAWAVLRQSVFPSLSVSGSLCLTFKPCLLTLLVKTGLYFSFLECAVLVQVVERSKLSSFTTSIPSLPTIIIPLWEFFLLSSDACEGGGGVSDGICCLLMFPGFSLNAVF